MKMRRMRMRRDEDEEDEDEEDEDEEDEDEEDEDEKEAGCSYDLVVTMRTTWQCLRQILAAQTPILQA